MTVHAARLTELMAAADAAEARSADLRVRAEVACAESAKLRRDLRLATGAATSRQSALLVEIDELRTAMQSRADVEQAKGVIMARIACDAERALEVLQAQAQQENRPLDEVAASVVAASRTSADGD